MKKRERKKMKVNRKILKAIAFSEMFMMVLASFAFAFILSSGMVSGLSSQQEEMFK